MGWGSLERFCLLVHSSPGHHFSIPVGWLDYRSAQSLTAGQLWLLEIGVSKLRKPWAWDNTPSRGPIQPQLSQWV